DCGKRSFHARFAVTGKSSDISVHCPQVDIRHLLFLLAGLATGLVGFFNNLAVENIAGFKLFPTCNLKLEHRHLAAFCALCAYVAPAAAGPGIPEVKAYLNGVDAYSILAPRTLFVKVVKRSSVENICCCCVKNFNRGLP
ncbi:Chloride channel protein, partial [Musa troglodytarum]